MVKLNFCTLFNSSYLSRGVLLYHSLERTCPDFHLYVFAFDQAAYDFLVSQDFPRMTVISLAEFEDADLLRIKQERTAGEYCWTCSSSTILYSIEKFGLGNCTYVDADMCFFSDPGILVREMGDNSVLITAHRYSEAYDQSERSGKYCVQFVTFKNDERGMKVLRHWRNSCIDWCFDRVEDGKFGDQKYLDDWERDFEGIHVLQHHGGGLAPWNMQQYDFFLNENKIYGRERKSGEEFEAVFFHFHGLRLFSDQVVSLTGDKYEMNRSALPLFFRPYMRELVRISDEIKKKTGNAFNPDGAEHPSPGKPLSLLSLLRYYQYDARKSIKNLSGRKTMERLAHYHYFSIPAFIKLK